MNDYWNDPPEAPEPPECCGEMMGVDKDGACICGKCGKRIEPEPPEVIELPSLEEYYTPPENHVCPHGKEPSECDACYRMSDFLYDVNRENGRR
jgi:hypothetical protein